MFFLVGWLVGWLAGWLVWQPGRYGAGDGGPGLVDPAVGLCQTDGGGVAGGRQHLAQSRRAAQHRRAAAGALPDQVDARPQSPLYAPQPPAGRRHVRTLTSHTHRLTHTHPHTHTHTHPPTKQWRSTSIRMSLEFRSSRGFVSGVLHLFSSLIIKTLGRS